MTKNNFNELPNVLPVPSDDGACNHLQGKSIPFVALKSTSGGIINLSKIKEKLVLYFYPMTGKPGVSLPEGWDLIPGARGCTPQACSFRDHYKELRRLNSQVFGVSTQSTEYQQEFANRNHLPFSLLSDEHLTLANSLKLPLFEVDSMTLNKRVTLIIHNGAIKKVFYPVFPPNKNADEVIDWLSSH